MARNKEIFRKGDTALVICDMDIWDNIEYTYKHVKAGTRIFFESKIRTRYGYVRVYKESGVRLASIPTIDLKKVDRRIIKLLKELEVEIYGFRNCDEELRL